MGNGGEKRGEKPHEQGNEVLVVVQLCTAILLCSLGQSKTAFVLRVVGHAVRVLGVSSQKQVIGE